MPFRLKRPEPLALELTLCARLGEGQAVHGIPPFAIQKSARLTLCRPVVSGSARFGIDMVSPAYSASVSLRSEGRRMNRLSEGVIS